jgi:hypothetical protein
MAVFIDWPSTRIEGSLVGDRPVRPASSARATLIAVFLPAPPLRVFSFSMRLLTDDWARRDWATMSSAHALALEPKLTK